jgi:hypothetical protein
MNRGAIQANMWQGLGSGLDQMAKDVAMAMAGVPPGMGGGGGGGGFDFSSILGLPPGTMSMGGSGGNMPGFAGIPQGNQASLNAITAGMNPTQNFMSNPDPFGWGSI